MKPAKDMGRLWDLLLNKYRADPEGFRRYLPDVAQALDSSAPASQKSRGGMGLTEHERARRLKALRRALARLDDGSLDEEGGVQALEHCAALIEDGALPPEADHGTLVQLVRAVVGKSPGSIKSVTSIPVRNVEQEKAPNQVSLVKGVFLHLTWDMQLASIAVSPTKMKERQKALRFVGVAQDAATDVSERHDAYLAETASRAPS